MIKRCYRKISSDNAKEGLEGERSRGRVTTIIVIVQAGDVTKWSVGLD